jgi:hypothetical protein
MGYISSNRSQVWDFALWASLPATTNRSGLGLRLLASTSNIDPTRRVLGSKANGGTHDALHRYNFVSHCRLKINKTHLK